MDHERTQEDRSRRKTVLKSVGAVNFSSRHELPWVAQKPFELRPHPKVRRGSHRPRYAAELAPSKSKLTKKYNFFNFNLPIKIDRQIWDDKLSVSRLLQ